MNTDYEFLVEKEEMWANLLMEVLKDNGILPAALPVYGAGLVIETGMLERLKIYVPRKNKAQAVELLQELFATETAQMPVLCFSRP